MAQVSVVVNGRSYAVTCDDGQEQHLLRLAADVEHRVGKLVATIGQVGQERLLLLVSLLLADEVAEKLDGGSAAPASEPAPSAAGDQALGDELRTLARRIETMAHRLQQNPAEPGAGVAAG